MWLCAHGGREVSVREPKSLDGREARSLPRAMKAPWLKYLSPVTPDFSLATRLTLTAALYLILSLATGCVPSVRPGQGAGQRWVIKA